MLFLPAFCLSICIATIEARSRESRRLNWRNTWSYTKKASCALDHSSLSNNVPVDHCDILRLIWWDQIGYPSFVYPTPCKQMNYWVDLILLYLFLGLMLYWIMIMSHYYCWFIIIHGKIIVLIGTWRTTQENSATTRVVWDALRWLIRKGIGGLPYPKGARAVEELTV